MRAFQYWKRFLKRRIANRLVIRSRSYRELDALKNNKSKNNPPSQTKNNKSISDF
ncbi:hypothetical protein Hdeb2414_s0011g00363321 [Helianthus debilis subsp. tardiflorus]